MELSASYPKLLVGGDVVLFNDGIIHDKENSKVVFLNTYSLKEYFELLQDMLNHAIEDLSVITGIDKNDLLADYISMHEYDPIREILKKNGKYDAECELKSLALSKLEKE